MEFIQMCIRDSLLQSSASLSYNQEALLYPFLMLSLHPNQESSYLEPFFLPTCRPTSMIQ